ncbi:MAG: hypothetical protein Q7J85_10015 [Bacillota bacterium]|nr:hypothetical protein [Bacillota bacterium]
MKKTIQVLIREVDETGKVISDKIISEIEPIDLGPPNKLTESDKLAWLSKVEQNAVDAASTLKKTLQLNKYSSKKSK